MRAGRLDRRITIQRKSAAQDDAGEPIEAWTTLVGPRWASVVPAKGDERFAAPAYAAKEQVEFQVRWSQDVASLTPLDRIVYPAVEDTSPPAAIDAASVYDILAVHEIGRREGLRILTFRRADA